MTAQMTPTGAALRPPSSAPTDVFGRMLADDNDIVTLAHGLRDEHLMDAGGPLLASFARLDGLMEAAAIEIRLIKRYLGDAQ